MLLTSQQSFAANQYKPRAQSYIASTVHSRGPDLDQLAAILSGMSDARVLDLGCGGGHVSYCAAPNVAEVVAADVTQAMLDKVRATAAERGLSNIITQIAAAESLPFDDGSFDVVLSRFSTHHWENMDTGLREARRVLKPSGFSIFIDVVASSNPILDTHLQAIELLRDPSHVRNYTVAEWVAAFARAGFNLQGITMRTLRMEFEVWISRTATPAERVQAIRSLQSLAPDIVHSHFSISDDGDFDINSATFIASAASTTT